MGEVAVNVELENPGDRDHYERGHGQESDIRRTSIEAIVDTGAVMPVLPRNVVERQTPPLWWAPVELGVEYEALLVEGEDERADELHELIASGYAAPDTGG